MTTEPVHSDSRTPHTQPAWRFVGADEEGGRKDWLETITSVAHALDRIEEHGSCQMSVKLWSIYPPLIPSPDTADSRGLWTRDTICQQKTFGLSLSYLSQTKSAERREVHQRLSKLLRAAGWIRFRPRRHERWLPLTSGRALITHTLASSTRPVGRGSPPSLYRVQLRLLYHCGEGLSAGESGDALSSVDAPELTLVHMLRLAQTHEMSPVLVNHVEVHTQWHDLTLELCGVDQHLIDWASHHPQVEVLEVSLLPEFSQRRYRDAHLTAREPDLWRLMECPADWPKPLMSLQDQIVHPELMSPNSQIAVALEPVALPLYISNDAYSHLSPRTQSYDALLFEERFESMLKDTLTRLPERLRRRVGVSILELRQFDTNDHNDKPSKAAMSRQTSKRVGRRSDQPIQTLSANERATYILVRLTGLDHITAQERRDLRSELPYDQSVDQLVMKTCYPTTYQSQGLSFTFPVSRRALSELIQSRQISAKTHQRRDRLIMISRYFSLLWYHERSSHAETSTATRACLIEITPWREYRGDDLRLALSKSHRARLREWLDDASIVIPARSVATQRDESS